MVRAPSNWFFGQLMLARRLLALIALGLGDREVLRVFRRVVRMTDAAPALEGFSLMLVVRILMAMIVESCDGLTYGA